jgi:hypothetical protein
MVVLDSMPEDVKEPLERKDASTDASAQQV